MLQFIVMKENHHESKPFLEYWTKYFNKMDIDFKVIWNGSFAEEDGINLDILEDQNSPLNISSHVISCNSSDNTRAFSF